MKMVSRAILFSVLTLLLISSACTPAQTPPAPLVTMTATGQSTLTPMPTNTQSNETPTAFIPITGMDVVSLQCQFCVNEEAHAVLIMSNLTFFNVSDPASGVTCLTAQEVNDKRIVLCRGAQQAAFQLDVCVDDANCLQFPITLQRCPLIPQTGQGTPVVTLTAAAPILLTPINTLAPPDDPDEEATPRPRRTPTPPPATTAPPPPTSVTEPPPTEPPTEEPTEPPATEEPTEPPATEAPTDPPTSDGNPTREPKPTKVPKPTKTDKP